MSRGSSEPSHWLERVRVVATYLRIMLRTAMLIWLRRPYKLSLLIAGGCNLRCRICSSWKRKNSTLTLDEVRRIWEAFRIKPCWVNISGGEPTLNPALESILLFFVSMNRPLLITLTTNGIENITSLIERVLHRDQRSLVYISVSIDGDAPAHDTARGHPGAFASARHTFECLATSALSTPFLKVGMSTTVSRFNFDQLPSFVSSVLKETLALNLNLARVSDYYGNLEEEPVESLPRGPLVRILREVQRSVVCPTPDSVLKVVFLETAIRRLQGKTASFPCSSFVSNVLITSDLDLMTCTLCFEKWHDQISAREEKLESLVDAIRHPSPRRSVLHRRIRLSGCEERCLTPCESYMHIIASLLNPIRAPGIVGGFVRIYIASLLTGSKRRARRRIEDKRAIHGPVDERS